MEEGAEESADDASDDGSGGESGDDDEEDLSGSAVGTDRDSRTVGVDESGNKMGTQMEAVQSRKNRI